MGAEMSWADICHMLWVERHVTTREERKSDISEISFVSFNFVTQKTTSSIDRDGGSGGLIYFC